MFVCNTNEIVPVMVNLFIVAVVAVVAVVAAVAAVVVVVVVVGCEEAVLEPLSLR